MKFGKKYEAYMRGMEADQLPAVGIKRLKKMLSTCRRSPSPSAASNDRRCTGGHCCTVCDGSFFPSLVKEMSAVVGCFNEKAKKLLRLHLASSSGGGLRKYYATWMCFTTTNNNNKKQQSHGRLVQQGKDLVTYAIINAVAMRKILKKYDKLFCRYITRSKGKSSKLKRRASTSRYSSPHGSVSSWPST